MEIKLTESNNVTIVTLKGRLDLSSGSSLKEQIKLLFNKDKTDMHLNLADVEFINSSGLGVLVAVLKETRLHKGRLTLSNLTSYIQEIFDITQLSHIFEIYATQKEALESFTKKIIVTEIVDVTVVNFEGSLNASGGKLLENQVRTLFEDGKRDIHLNLSKVELIDAWGLMSLMAIAGGLLLLKGRLTINLHKAIHVTALLALLAIYSTEEEALASHR